MERFIGLAGILAFMAIAYLLSHKQSAIYWKTIAWGLGLQWIFALIVLKGTVISGLLPSADSLISAASPFRWAESAP